MQTETITYLKQHANTLELREALLITKNGKPAFVVQSYQDYQDYQDYQFQQDTLAKATLSNIKHRIKQDSAAQPSLAPVSERLLALGVADYRQWQVD